MDSLGKAITMRTLYPEDLEDAYAIETTGLFFFLLSVCKVFEYYWHLNTEPNTTFSV